MPWRSNANAADLPMAGGRRVGLGCGVWLVRLNQLLRARHQPLFFRSNTALNLSNIFGSRKPFRENAAVVKRRSHIPVAFDVFPPRPA